MRILFFIQGEGRGHQTQALAAAAIFRQARHTLAGAIVGTRDGRTVPPFLAQGLGCPLLPLAAPSLRFGGRGLSVSDTFFANVFRMGQYWQQAVAIEAFVAACRPDVAVNFYEMLCGIWHWHCRPALPTLSVAHQYLLQHPGFELPRRQALPRWLLGRVNELSAIGSRRRLGLSFYELPAVPEKNIYPLPPLLRPEVLALTPTAGDYLLAYMTHHPLGADLEAWCRRHPDVPVRAFWNHPAYAAPYSPLPSLTFFPLHPADFLVQLQGCRAFASTAGFESICEALYLGKPVMLFPTPGQFEQAANAIDAERAGAGIRATSFHDLDRLLAFIPHYQNASERFRAWQARLPALLLEHLEAIGQEPAAGT